MVLNNCTPLTAIQEKKTSNHKHELEFLL